MHQYNKFVLALGTCMPLVFSSVSFADSFRMPTSPNAVPSTNSQPQKGNNDVEYLSFPDSADSASLQDAVSAYIPENSKDLKFLGGSWEFDRDFVGEDGKKLDTKFFFDDKGQGRSVLTTEDGKQYEAKSVASFKDDRLHIETEEYKSDDSDKTFKGVAFNCSLENGKTECDSDDNKWKDVAFLAADDKTKEMVKNYLAGSNASGDEKSEANNAEQAGTENNKGEGQATKPKEQEYLDPAAQAAETFSNTGDNGGLEENNFFVKDSPIKQVPKDGTPMIIPEQGKDMKFAQGEWNFDKDFIDNNGKNGHASFTFDDKGNGQVKITSDGKEYKANAHGNLEDGSFKIITEKFLSDDGKSTAQNMFIECQNHEGSAVCRGTDGFKVWGNERMLASDDTARKSAEQARADNETVKNGGEDSGQNAANAGDAEPRQDGKDPAKEAAEKFSELDGGSELPPDVMEDAVVAKDDGKNDMALEGDWRYSQDFSRKSDGDAVSLGFHFDKDGKGYSTIKEGQKSEARAKAEAQKMPDGSYRVKTDAYTGGEKDYYPTFMDCKADKSKDIRCNVSNGWLRLEDGRLVAADSLNTDKNNPKYEELTLPSESKDQRQSQSEPSADAMNNSTEDLLSALTQSSPQDNKQDDAAKEPQPSASQPKNENSALSLPDNTNSIDFLNGKWSCNTGLFTNGDANLPVILEFSFDKNGKGTSIIREKKTGMAYKASVSANYNKNKKELRLVTSDFYNKQSNSSYSGQSIVCHEDTNSHRAVCSGKARDGSSASTWKNTPFIRSK